MNETSPTQPKIALAGVTKSFENNHVLSGLDLSAPDVRKEMERLLDIARQQIEAEN